MRLEVAISLLVALLVIIGWLDYKTDKCKTCRHYDKKERICEHPYCIHQFTVMDEHDSCGFYERKEEEK